MGNSFSWLRKNSTQVVPYRTPSLDGYDLKETETLSQKDLNFINKSWINVLENNSPRFKLAISETNSRFKHNDCESWFMRKFFDKIFTLRPALMTYFATEAEKKELINYLFSFQCMTPSSDDLRFNWLVNLAEYLSLKSFTSNDISVLETAILWSFSEVLGSYFCDNSKVAWKKLINQMMSVVVPYLIPLDQAKLGIKIDLKSKYISSRKPTIHISQWNSASSFAYEDMQYS